MANEPKKKEPSERASGGFASVERMQIELKWMKEALHESTQCYQMLAESEQDLIFIVDREFYIQYVNSHAARFLNLPPDKIIEQPLEKIFSPESHHHQKKNLAKVFESGVAEHVEAEVVVHGRPVWLDSWLVPVTDTKGEVAAVLGISRDVTERKRAEEALKASEEQYRTTIEGMADPMHVVDSGLRIVLANQAFKKWAESLGLPEPKAGEKITDVFRFLPPEVAGEYERVFKEKQPLVTEEHFTLKGSVITVEVRKIPIIEGKKVVRVTTIVRDISARKCYEGHLGKMNDCFLKLGQDPALNIETLTALCGEILGADCALYNRLEGDILCSHGMWKAPPDFKKSDNAKGHLCGDVITRGIDDVLVVRDLMGSSYAETDPNVRAYGLKTYIGYPVRFGGKVVGSLCAAYTWDYEPTSEDRKLISIIAGAIGLEEERRSAGKLLEESEWKFKALAEASSAAIFIFQDETFRYVNPAIVSITGYSAEELVGKNIFFVITPEFRGLIAERMKARFRGEDVSSRLELKILRKDGAERWVDATAGRIEYGGTPAIVVTWFDITEQKRLTEKLNYFVNFEKLVTSLSTKFISLEPEGVDRSVAEALEAIGTYAGIDRAYIFQFFNDHSIMDCIYEWCAPDVQPSIDRMKNVATEKFRYFMNRMKAREAFYISRVSDLGPDAANEKKAFELARIQSLLCIPMVYGGELIGFVGFDSVKRERRWSDEDISLYRVIGEIFVNALAHKHSDIAIHEGEKFLSNIFSSIQDGISVLDTDMTVIRVNQTMEKWYASAMPLVGKKCHEVYHGSKKPCAVCPTKRVIETGESAYDVIPWRDQDRRIIGWHILYSYPLLDQATGRLTGVIEYVRDITEQKKAEEALRENESLLRESQAIAGLGSYVLDVTTGSWQSSDVLDKVFGIDKTYACSVEGWLALVHPDDRAKMSDYLKREVFGLKKGFDKEYRIIRCNDHAERWVHGLGRLEIDADGRVLRMVGTIQDITARKKAEDALAEVNKELLKSNKRLEHLALRDLQTGLYNHRYLIDVIEAEMLRARRYGHPLSVIMIDIDYFKSINDVYGHQFGDLVLKQLALQLKKIVRQYDIVVRFGGEEFVIVSPATDRARSLLLAQRILEAINLYNFGNRKQVVKLKLSLAVASYPEDSVVNGIDLIKLSDQILSKVKEFGGDRVYSSNDVVKSKGKKGSTQAEEKVEETKSAKFLQKKLERLTKRANQSLVEAVFAFAKTIKLKDYYTGEHVEQTVHYATELARSIHLPIDDVERIRQASILHDLGKIGVSDKILLKKAKLTKKEFGEISKHPQIGVDIIRPIHFLRDIIPLMLYHHERWDGRGYPTGLKRDEIPIGARVIAIADVFQALISRRSYRKAYSRKEAIEIIKSGSGTQFDPKIVSVFLKILQREKK